MNLTLSDTAYSQIGHLLKEHDKKFVRLQVKGGGCAGFSYKWDLVKTSDELVEDDFPQEYNDWTFWLDRPSELYLIGSTVNKKVDIIGSVIEIQAPLASSSCGCGESINFNL